MARAASKQDKAGGLRTLAVDIGGSGIKALILDDRGRPVSPRSRVETPKPATPKAVIDVVAGLARRTRPFDRVSVGFPGVVRKGVTINAPNLDPSWNEFKLAEALAQRLGKPVRVANDADVQGFGAIAGQGVELVITLGTGVGSALFVGGALVPNLEVGHYPFRKGMTYEEQLGNRALKKAGPAKWNKRLLKAIEALDLLFNYDLLYLGGGNTKHITVALPPHVKIVPNVTGLLGGIALWKAGS